MQLLAETQPSEKLDGLRLSREMAREKNLEQRAKEIARRKERAKRDNDKDRAEQEKEKAQQMAQVLRDVDAGFIKHVAEWDAKKDEAAAATEAA